MAVSLRMSSPLSVSTAIVLLLDWMEETFVDQTVFCFPSTSLMFPLLPIFKLAAESLARRGFSLFATHNILRTVIFLCHNPIYSFLERPGLKNPNSNTSPAETRLWFTESCRDRVKDDNSCFTPSLTSYPRFIPGIIVSVGTAVVLLLEWMETFVDQTVFCSPSTNLRFPSLPIFKLEAESLATRGFSLFATHRIEQAGTFLYHSPTYSFLELRGLKNPNSNIPPAETRLWFTKSRWDWVKVSSAVQYSVKRIKACERERKQNFNSLAMFATL
nr:hypothetical protein PRUPE_4G033100 [Ipomoea batatas]